MIYEPSEDSFLLAEQVKKYAKDKIFLDIGSGSGIQAEVAKNNNAKSVLASDIQEEVIKNLKKKKISCVKSDLFSNIKGKFDIIAFNPPYLPEDKREDIESRITTTGGKKGDEIILRFLQEATEHLNKNGIILLLVSSLTPRFRILNLLRKLNLKKEKLSSKNLFMEVLEVWKIEKNNNP